MNLIILFESDRLDDSRFRLADYRAEHIRTVLGAEVGDTLQVGLLNGPVGVGRVEAVSSELVTLRVGELAELPPLTPQVDLICALPRPQTLKKVLLTSAMMGVRSIHLVRANRVEKSYFRSPLLAPDQMFPHLIEGLAQGKRTHLPSVMIHDRFRPFFEDYLATHQADMPGRRLVADPEAVPTLMTSAAGCDDLTVAIGPEGGWVPFELETMQRAGFEPFRLGPWTLRVEHAVTAVLAQLELVRGAR